MLQMMLMQSFLREMIIVINKNCENKIYAIDYDADGRRL